MPPWLAITLTTAGALLFAWLFLVMLFTPAVNYHVREPANLQSREFLRLLQATCQSAIYSGNRVEVFRNGDRFYPAMADVIRGARRSVNLECYIFEDGKTARALVDLLAERARSGVAVTVVLDAIGSSGWKVAAFDELERAGGRVEYYQSFKWYSLHRVNNRTHREILVVDGRTAFVGGAGVSDRWAMATAEPQWRDTMARIDGPIVTGIQGVAAENWLECCGEILTGDIFFPELAEAGQTTGLVIKSSPADRATSSRVVFQLLIESAAETLAICTPYFLPDRRLRAALVAAARRGVAIRIVVPGPRTDQRWVRIASRRFYGLLLDEGIRIFEYQPSMIHAKVLVVDRLWAILGTTNFDNRSFEHNDEVNVALRDEAVAARLLDDFAVDVEHSTEVTLETWRARPYWERLLQKGGWIFEREE